MKLWVDDIRPAPDDSWNVARSVTEAIRAIARFDFEVISLDHDISHYSNLDESDVDQIVYACKETFASVAYFIAEKYRSRFDTYHPKIILHTSNQVAGDEMATILKEAGIEPIKAYMGASL